MEDGVYLLAPLLPLIALPKFQIASTGSASTGQVENRKIIKNAIGNMMRQPPALLSIIFPVIHFIANSLAGKQYYLCKDCATPASLTQRVQ